MSFFALKTPIHVDLPAALPLAVAGGCGCHKGTPILMAHGLYDPVVPLMMGGSLMSFLAGLGYSVEWRQHPMPHAVCEQETADIGAWLRKILNPT